MRGGYGIKCHRLKPTIIFTLDPFSPSPNPKKSTSSRPIEDAYVTSIPVTEDDDASDAFDSEVARKLASYTAPKSILKEMPRGAGEDDGDLGIKKSQRIIDREDDYRGRRLNRVISPDRHDAFAAWDKTPDVSVRTYADIMREEALKREKENTLRAIPKKKKEEEAVKAGGGEKEKEGPAAQKRRNLWDQSQDDGGAGAAAVEKAKTGSDWDLPDSTPGIGRWDATPTPGRIGDATPSVGRRNRWDETPTPGRVVDSVATPGATPAGMTWDATLKLPGMATPTP
ncbi:hypothetical protein MLD38_026928 [Melastoma candidum]|uniref:Uncharacterized protein n=1 Tax=Melastoma candidum TaxID=119954 RepID=A0ACB9P1H3_9MYRT|nr:hypothetical protein MLD38_026928 [Melastoma candidum]